MHNLKLLIIIHEDRQQHIQKLAKQHIKNHQTFEGFKTFNLCLDYE